MVFKDLQIGDTFNFTSIERPGHVLDKPVMPGPWVKASNYLFVHEDDAGAVILFYHGIHYYQALFHEEVSKC